MAAPMSNVQVVENLPNKGRALIACKSFEESTALFEEEPIVSCQFSWNQLYKYQACDHCMSSLETAEENVRRLSGNPLIELPHADQCFVDKTQHITCPNCQVKYCSETCRIAAFSQYHRTLCLGGATEDASHPLNKLQEIWRSTHYPPETTSIMLICRMIAYVKQATDPDSVLVLFSKFCKATVNQEAEIAHKLLGKQFQVQLELLRQALGECLYEERIQQWFTPEGFRSLIAMIGTNGQGIGTSPFSVWVKNSLELDMPEEDMEKLDALVDKLYEEMDNVSGQFLDTEGSGLYALQSACNHSCSPNAEVTFPHNNSKLVVVATKDIKEGEEIFISYLDECVRQRSRHSRQKILRENYLFNCNCPKCVAQSGDPDETSEEEMEDQSDED